jgi:biotin operon repressor
MNFHFLVANKEEKIMPVEVERAIEGLREEGEIKAYVNLLREGLISEEIVLNKLNISKKELNKKIKKLDI